MFQKKIIILFTICYAQNSFTALPPARTNISILGKQAYLVLQKLVTPHLQPTGLCVYDPSKTDSFSFFTSISSEAINQIENVIETKNSFDIEQRMNWLNSHYTISEDFLTKNRPSIVVMLLKRVYIQAITGRSLSNPNNNPMLYEFWNQNTIPTFCFKSHQKEEQIFSMQAEFVAFQDTKCHICRSLYLLQQKQLVSEDSYALYKLCTKVHAHLDTQKTSICQAHKKYSDRNITPDINNRDSQQAFADDQRNLQLLDRLNFKSDKNREK